MTTKAISATERYRQQNASRQREVIDLPLPSGFVLKIAKPSKFEMIFRYGKLPQTAANGAVQSWIDAGVVQPGDIEENAAIKIDAAIKLRDKVLELSVEPKLVVGEALNPNELSTDELSDEDSEFLFKWVASGGVDADGIGTFPRGAEPSALASSGRKKRSVKA